MKRFFSLIVCLIMLIPSALAETPARKLEESDPLYTSLRERALEMAGLFDEALRSDAYLLFYLADLSRVEDTVGLLRTQDFTQPLDVTIVCAADALASSEPFQAVETELEKAGFSPALSQLMRQKLYGGTASILLSQGSMYKLALASALTFSDAFIRPEEMDGPCFAVMQYGGLYAFLVTFMPTANGTVTAIAQFIPSRAADDLNLPIE